MRRRSEVELGEKVRRSEEVNEEEGGEMSVYGCVRDK